VLLAVARQGSLSGAARSIGCSTDEVRRALLELERRLGEALLVEDGGSVRLLPAGDRVVDGLRDQREALLRRARGAWPQLMVALEVGRDGAMLTLKLRR